MATKKSLDLTDLFYKKSETRTRTEITNEIAEAIRNLTIFDYAESFNQLPTGGNIRPNKIYIVPNSGSIVQRNRYDFYMYFDNQWEQIDALPFDIEDYVKIEDIVDNLLSNDADKALSANQGRILKALIDSKVDKVSGKGLSSNDFTNSYKSALDNLDSNLNAKVDKVAGKGLSANDYTTNEKNKLASIEAEANKTVVDDSFIANSTNPVQSKVVKSALDNKADTDDLADVALTGDYDDLENKPTSMNPTAHNHSISDVTNLQSNLDAKMSSSDYNTVALSVVFEDSTSATYNLVYQPTNNGS